MQPEGGSISFLEGYDKSQLRLAYVNGSREYVVFDPDSDEILERSAEGLAGDEETGGNLLGDFRYASLYGQLLDYDKKRMENVVSLATSPFVLSERQWETIFSGYTLNFPPLQKLCGQFFESLMEKRTAPCGMNSFCSHLYFVASLNENKIDLITELCRCVWVIDSMRFGRPDQKKKETESQS